MPAWYPTFLEAVTAHLWATADEPLLACWTIGHEILRWRQKPDWTSRVIDHLSTDLKARFPTRKGLSSRNLRYMRTFAEAWPHESFARGPLAGLPWHHHLVLLQKLDNLNLRIWYAKQSLDNNWTRATLTAQIAANLHRRPRRSRLP